MLKKFTNWYNKKFKKYPIIVLLTTIVAIFTAIGSSYSGIQAIQSAKIAITHSIFKNHKEYEKLSKVNVNLNVEFIDQLMGKPFIIRPMENEPTSRFFNKYTERLYVDDNYFLYVLTDNLNQVLLYEITLRKSDFYPSIPLNIRSSDKKNEITNLKLGVMKLSDLKNNPSNICADYSSKFIYYTETHLFGNAVGYKIYLFGYTPAGISNLSDDQINTILKYSPLKNEKVGSKERDVFDKNFIPNSFGVISDTADEELQDYLINGMMGIDYFIAREFNNP